MSRRLVARRGIVMRWSAGAAWWWRSASATPRRRLARHSPSASGGAGRARSPPGARDGRRVIFIGLDGADWSLLDAYAADGTMPTLARLVREGSQRGPRRPAPAAVASRVDDDADRRQPARAPHPRLPPREPRDAPARADHQRRAAGARDLEHGECGRQEVGSLGFWATYPAEPVNGLMVSDRLFTFLYSEAAPPPGVVFPASLQDWASDGLQRAQAAGDYDGAESDAAVARSQGLRRSGGHHRSLRASRQRAAADPDRDRGLQRSRPRLVHRAQARSAASVYIQGTDSVGHVFAPYAPPRQPSISADDYARYSDVPARYFAHVDAILEQYRALAESTGSVLMLASDHGFTWGEGRPAELSSVANATAARWHAENGIYLLWGKGIRPRRATPATEACSRCARRCSRCSGCRRCARRRSAAPRNAAAAPAAIRSTTAKSFTPIAAMAAAPAANQSRVDEETVAKLRALGYIGGAEGNGRAAGTRTAGSLNNEGLLLKQAGQDERSDRCVRPARSRSIRTWHRRCGT